MYLLINKPIFASLLWYLNSYDPKYTPACTYLQVKASPSDSPSKCPPDKHNTITALVQRYRAHTCTGRVSVLQVWSKSVASPPWVVAGVFTKRRRSNQNMTRLSPELVLCGSQSYKQWGLFTSLNILFSFLFESWEKEEVALTKFIKYAGFLYMKYIYSFLMRITSY